MTVQLVIFSSTAQNVRPALVLVNNRLERVGAEMTWPDLLGLVAEVAIAARQYTDV